MIASDFSRIAADLKQIEADKVQMLKGKPPESTPDELSLLEAETRAMAAKLLRGMDHTKWGTAGYTSIDFDPA